MQKSGREYPLILVDDEPLARQAVSSILEENFPFFPIIGEADSGPGGVALFREKRPGIVIMDIRIPGYDGLEASRLILKESPGTQVIVLSAYDDFKYVQEALHEGALGYLLKPVRTDSLGVLLEKAVKGISVQESRNKDKQTFKVFSSIAIREQVASFIYGQKGGIPAEDFAQLSNPPITHGYFIIFHIDRRLKLSSDEIRKVHISLDRLIGCLSGNWMGRYLPVFIRTDNDDTDAWRSEAVFLSREITHLINDSIDGQIRHGIGPVMNESSRFAESFHMAFDILQEEASPREIASFNGFIDRYPVDKETEFLDACRASDGTAALKAAGNLADDLISPEASLMDARFAVTEFLIVFRREWESISGTPKRQAMANLLREVLLCNEYDVLKEWFLLVVRDLIGNLLDFGNREDGGREDLVLRKVRHYIDLNNLREVSLETTAESIGITAPYLSRLFKDKTGEHFHDYVTRRRMDTAAGMLKETSMAVKDIANQVGYTDVSYFSRIFRTRYGSSPRDYRRNR